MRAGGTCHGVPSSKTHPGNLDPSSQHPHTPRNVESAWLLVTNGHDVVSHMSARYQQMITVTPPVTSNAFSPTRRDLLRDLDVYYGGCTSDVGDSRNKRWNYKNIPLRKLGLHWDGKISSLAGVRTFAVQSYYAMLNTILYKDWH